MKEIWKPIPKFEGYYEASSYGRVRSVSRLLKTRGNKTRQHKGRVKTIVCKTDGYLAVMLSVGNKTHTKNVHALVAITFLGPRPKGKEVRHRDGDKSNNRLGNLRYGSKKRSEQDKRKHGTAPIGENNGRSVLSANDVEFIRSKYKPGHKIYGSNALARRFGVSQPNISYITTGKSWKNRASIGN